MIEHRVDISNLRTTDAFCRRAAAQLRSRSSTWRIPGREKVSGAYASAVLLLVGRKWLGNRFSSRPHLILNKRSQMVRQPGDLCCPGGGIEMPWDLHLSRLLQLPVLPLWRFWPLKRTEAARTLALLLATGLRESYEEMGLNPLKVRFLGPLPPQRLIMFNRVVYPLVGWLEGQRKFRLNWEVASITTIPIEDLLKKQYYARYLLQMAIADERKGEGTVKEFPCFIARNAPEGERLWGVTYRIVMELLQAVFNFAPPHDRTLPQVEGHLSKDYLTGTSQPYQRGQQDNL